MSVLLRLLRYARPYRGRIAWAILATLVYAAASGALAALIKLILDRALPRQIHVALIAWEIIGFYLLKGLGAYFSDYLMSDVGQRVVRDLRNSLHEHMLGQSAAFFARRTTGQLLSRLTNDVAQVQHVVAETVATSCRRALGRLFAGLLSTTTPSSRWCA